MDRSRSDEIWREWQMVRQSARRPADAPRPSGTRSAMPFGMAALAAVLVLIVVVGTRGILNAPAAWSSASAHATVASSGGLSESASPTDSAAPAASGTISPSATSSATASPLPIGTPLPGDEATALATAREYEEDLVHGRFKAAWDLLAPEEQAARTYSQFASDWTAFTKTTSTSYTLEQPTSNWATWNPTPLSANYKGDFSRAFLIRVDWKIVPASPADWNMLLVLPGALGKWEVAEVR